MKRALPLLVLLLGSVLGGYLAGVVPLDAAFITYPKTFTAGTQLTAADLNAQFAAITTQVNGNLEDDNIKTTAGILGSKIASSPNGISTSQLNDDAVTAAKIAADAVGSSEIATGGVGAIEIATGAVQTSEIADLGVQAADLASDAVTTAKITDLNVTTGKIAVNGTTNAFTSVTPTSVSETGTTERTVVTLPSITTRGGRVHLYGTWALRALVSASASDTLTLRIKRDGSTIVTILWSFSMGSLGDTTALQLPAPHYVDVGASAAAHVYTVTLQMGTGSGAGLTFSNPAQGVIYAEERA